MSLKYEPSSEPLHRLVTLRELAFLFHKKIVGPEWTLLYPTNVFHRPQAEFRAQVDDYLAALIAAQRRIGFKVCVMD